MQTQIHAWLATSRFSNLPTVWSQVFVAVYLCCLSHGVTVTGELGLVLSILCIGSSLLYLGGCILGDAFDVEFDSKTRPERPLPSGVIKLSQAFSVAMVFLVIGYIAMAFGPSLLNESSLLSHSSVWVGILIGCIVLYARFHKSNKHIGLLLMVSCRFFLVIGSAAAFLSWLGVGEKLDIKIWLYALTVALYTAGIVVVARTETSRDPFSRQSLLTVLMFGLPFVILFREVNLTLFSAIAYIVYIALACACYFRLRKNQKGEFVSLALAGFCLLDNCVLGMLGVNFGWLVCIPLLGFFVALLFQRLAPAT